jgi:hypothetical protein
MISEAMTGSPNRKSREPASKGAGQRLTRLLEMAGLYSQSAYPCNGEKVQQQLTRVRVLVAKRLRHRAFLMRGNKKRARRDSMSGFREAFRNARYSLSTVR